MADGNDSSYVLGRLVLDYIRAFMWPLVAIVVVVIYQDDVRQILAERQVDIFGLRIGDRVEQIESRTMAEIEDIRLLLETQRQAEASGSGSPEVAEDLVAKLASLERNLSREISQVQSEQQALQAAPPSTRQAAIEAESQQAGRASRAAAAERRGFEALIEHDVDRAIAAFDEAREIWPEYHNVAEIGRALRKRRDALAALSAESWSELYRDILARYSWGLPEDLRAAIRNEVAQAY